MPIFEYNCRRCDKSFEQLVLNVKETVRCPACDSNAVEKQLSVFSSPGSDSQASARGCGCTPQTCGCH